MPPKTAGTAIANRASAAVLAQLDEHLRQQRETFEQRKRQDHIWFGIQVVVAVGSVVILVGVAAASAVVVFHPTGFSEKTVALAATTLFVDLFATVGAVWKVVLSPRENALAATTPAPDISALLKVEPAAPAHAPSAAVPGTNSTTGSGSAEQAAKG